MGQANEIFSVYFLSSFEPAWATDRDQWIKIISIFVQISLSYSNFEKTDSLQYVSYILRGVIFFILELLEKLEM